MMKIPHETIIFVRYNYRRLAAQTVVCSCLMVADYDDLICRDLAINCTPWGRLLKLEALMRVCFGVELLKL
jgi:hypothetical protein